MTRGHSKIIALLLVLTSLGTTRVAAFPEIPFCPLGGPPGWANRIFDDRDDYYALPPYYGVPYSQRYPQYSPVYPSGYSYQQYPGRFYQGWEFFFFLFS